MLTQTEPRIVPLGWGHAVQFDPDSEATNYGQPLTYRECLEAIRRWRVERERVGELVESEVRT